MVQAHVLATILLPNKEGAWSSVSRFYSQFTADCRNLATDIQNSKTKLYTVTLLLQVTSIKGFSHFVATSASPSSLPVASFTKLTVFP